MDLHLNATIYGGATKHDFTTSYLHPDPAHFFTTFAEHDYQIPAALARLVTSIAASLATDHHHIIDVCSSYGINAALLNYDVNLVDFYDHYRQLDRTIDDDQAFYNARRRRDNAWPIVGVDTSQPAINYARNVGLIDAGITTNLEHHPATPADAASLGPATIVCISGGYGYVGPATFAELLDNTLGSPVIAGFVLRWIPTDDLTELLHKRGYQLTIADRHVHPQRRYARITERQVAMTQLRRGGRRPSTIDTDGHHGALPLVAYATNHPRRHDLDSIVHNAAPRTP